MLVIQEIVIILAALPLLNVINQGSLFLIFCVLYVQGIGGLALGKYILVFNHIIYISWYFQKFCKHNEGHGVEYL